MLICPQCQFENPDPNKFCQGCGTPLTNKVCSECGTQVAFSDQKCPNCNTVTGTVWWAIISKGARGSRLGAGEDSSPNPQPPIPSPSFLDPQQRYQLLEPLPDADEIAATTELQLRVVDCQPFQVSPLETGADTGKTVAIPQNAKPYLALQSECYQAVPAIHDAWQQDVEEVVLIADRSEWPQLIDLWQDDETVSEQILHWCYEMTELWAALQPWHCRQSLLELSNLRVDEDGVLGLQRLYREQGALKLKDLGQVWRSLCHESQKTKFGFLFQVCDRLEAGKIRTLDDLRSLLAAISTELQTNDTSTPELEPPVATIEPESTELNLEVEATNSVATVPDAVRSVPTEPDPIKVEQQEMPSQSGDLATIVLPMHLVSLEDAGCTDGGRQRHHNEDYFGIETTIHKLQFPQGRAINAHGLYILCDGMGGHAGGEVASSLAVKTLQQYFQTNWQQKQLPNEESLRNAVHLANQAIYDLNQQDARSGIGRMGTTLVMVLIQDTKVAIAHVGDSRLYRCSRKRGLEQLTVDHEVGQREIARGVPSSVAYARPDAYQLTQALGPRNDNFVNPDVQFLELLEDTLLVLASDGLSDNNLLEEHWQTHLAPLLSSTTNLEQGVRELIELANQYNGHDNITAVLIRAKIRPNLE